MTVTTAKALSHPLRVALLELLRTGPQTSAAAAVALATNTGATSFHLRQLERFGLVEPVAGRGREKPWRLVDPDPADAMDLRDDARWAAWRKQRDDYPRAWRRQSTQSYTLLLTAAEIETLAAGLLDVVAPYFARETDPALRPRGARPVAVQARVFPAFSPPA